MMATLPPATKQDPGGKEMIVMHGHSVSGTARFHCGLGAFFGWWGWRWGAVTAYGDALRVDPRLAEAHMRIGEVLSRQGRWHEASRAFREAVRLRATSLEAHGNLVLALSRAGSGAAAVHAMERMIRLRPHDAEPHLLLGALLRKLGRHAEAIRAFRWAVRLGPSPSWCRFFLGEALLGRREWNAALASFRLAQRLHAHAGAAAEADTAGRSCLNTHPGESVLDPASSTRRVRARVRRRPRRGWGELREGLRDLGTKTGAAIGAAKTDLRLLLRRDLFGRNSHLAIHSLRRGARLRTPVHATGARLASAVALSLLLPGVAAGAEGPEAREAAYRCVQLNREAGIHACREALRLGVKPERAAVVVKVLALELAALERWPEVVDAYRELVRLQPQDADAHLRLGNALVYGVGELELAVVSLRESIRLRPEARAWGSLGAALNGLERHQQALEAFEEALHLDPDYLEYRPGARRTFEASQRGERWPK